MFFSMEVSRLDRLVFIVARGELTMATARRAIDQLVKADVPAFAKIFDVSGVSCGLGLAQVRRMVVAARPATATRHGRVALVVDPDRDALGKLVAEAVSGDAGVGLFRSLHDARAFVDRKLVNAADWTRQAAD